jgi:flagellar protein FlaJ
MVEFFREEELEPGLSLEDKIVFGSLGVGGFVILVGVLIYNLISNQVGGAMVLLGLMAAVVPYGVFQFLKNRQRREMEEQFPLFLKGLAESKKGGMTLLNAFESAHDTDYGRLNPEIERVYHELTWGIPFPEVMQRFSDRMSESAVIQQSLSIIIQSFRSGGEITHTIETVAEDASRLRDAIVEKNSRLQQQLLIMYVIYFLFVGITVGVYFILQQLVGFGESGGGALTNLGDVVESAGEMVNYCAEGIGMAQPFCSIAQVFGFVPNVEYGSDYATEFGYGLMAYYKSMLFSMLMVQGMSSAAVAGKIREGSATAGIKHALIMLPLAFVVFMLVVAPHGT